MQRWECMNTLFFFFSFSQIPLTKNTLSPQKAKMEGSICYAFTCVRCFLDVSAIKLLRSINLTLLSLIGKPANYAFSLWSCGWPRRLQSKGFADKQTTKAHCYLFHAFHAFCLSSRNGYLPGAVPIHHMAFWFVRMTSATRVRWQMCIITGAHVPRGITALRHFPKTCAPIWLEGRSKGESGSAARARLKGLRGKDNQIYPIHSGSTALILFHILGWRLYLALFIISLKLLAIPPKSPILPFCFTPDSLSSFLSRPLPQSLSSLPRRQQW